MTPPEVSIIIISFNTKDMTLECIRSVFAETKKCSFEVLVYDNNSADGSAAAIRSEFPQVVLVESKENIGFARANNALIKQASSPYILLLNPDTVVLNGAIDKLMDFRAQRPDAGIWGGRTLFGDGSLNPGSCFRRMSIWNQFCRASGLAVIFRNNEFFNDEDYGGWLRDSVREVDIVCGCFLLITRQLWDRLGGFNRKYFMYAEEADLCLRAKAIGATPVITPDAEIIHYGGGSEKVRADKMIRLLRAKVTLAKDHWVSWQRPFASLLLGAWVLSRYFSFSVLRRLQPHNHGRADSQQSWKQIWVRKQEWIRGWEEQV